LQTDVSLRVNGGEAQTCVSEDVSPCGIFISTDERVLEGAPVDLVITLPIGRSSLVEARGRVAWVNNKSQPKKPDFPSGCGIELLEFREATEDVFRAFVNSFIPANCPQGNN
jgi:Tfp pilus assembly protein PilZ